MGVSLVQWRICIGLFNASPICKRNRKVDNGPYFSDFFLLMLNFAVKSIPLRVTYGLFIIFVYGIMTFFFLPIWFLIYPYTYFSHDNPSICVLPIVHYFVAMISKIFLFPCSLMRLLKQTSFTLKILFSEVKNVCFLVVVLQMLLLISGSVEINPGPPPPRLNNLSFAVWNLDSLPAREFARTPLIETLQSTYNFDLFGVCESMLNSNVPNSDIFINGFSPDPYRSDKAANVRNGGVCLYYKESLPLKRRSDLEKLPETIVSEIKLKRKKVFFCSFISSSKYAQ